MSDMILISHGGPKQANSRRRSQASFIIPILGLDSSDTTDNRLHNLPDISHAITAPCGANHAAQVASVK